MSSANLFRRGARIRFLALCFTLFLFFGYSMSAQTLAISGKVTDADTGESIIGASLLIQGTTEGTITDNDGNYTMDAPEGAVIEVSYFSYESFTFVVGQRAVVNVQLAPATYELDDVVVIGYGTTRKSDLTGSVGSVSARQLQEVPVTNPQLALQGRIPGVQVTQTDFSPSGGLEIRIRGTRSFQASNDPLYVVDGMPLSTGLSFLDPGDIESIDVLKDASATAIYGSRGANGVVIVTTKRGKEGRATVDYNGYIGIQTIGKQLELMNAAEWIEYMRESHRQANANLKYNSDVADMQEDMNMTRFNEDPYVLRTVMMGWNEDGTEWDPDKVRGFDWLGAVTRTGIIHNHNLNVSGGTAKTNYSVGVSYSENDGVVKNRDFQRITARSAIDSQVKKWLKVGMTTMFAHTIEHLDTGLYSKAAKMSPASWPLDDDGEFIELPGNDTSNWNILMDLEDGAVSRERTRDRVLGNIYALFSIYDGLTFRSSFSLDYDMYTDGDFRASRTSANIGGDNTASLSNRRSYSYTFENMLDYRKEFKGGHTLNATLVQVMEGVKVETSSIDAKGIPIDTQKWYNLGSANEIVSVGSNLSRNTLSSFLGRVNYNFKDRYLVTASLRYDGASVLADGHKWAAFPSAAAAWRISEEPFMDSAGKYLSNLKLRIGWGRTGNAAVSAYSTQGVLSDTKYVFGSGSSESHVIGYRPSELANHDLGWEYTEQTNIGIDFGFFKGRIAGSIDAYLQNTNNLLMDRKLPVALGYDDIIFNIGKTRNMGLEIALNTVNVITKSGFTWTTDWVFATNKEEIVELYNGKVDDIGTGKFIGQPINVWYGYKFDRIWTDSPEDLALMEEWNKAGNTNYVPGTIKLVDVNGDKKITADEDRMILGNPRPKFTASLTSNMTFKGFDFSFMLYADYGRMIKNEADMGFNGRQNQPVYDYWTPRNPDGTYPQPYRDSESPTAGSDYMTAIRYEDGSFLRMREMTLGYSLPKQVLQKAMIDRLRVYFTVQNPFIITSFSGVDPEAAHGNDYPMVRSFIFGVNFTF